MKPNQKIVLLLLMFSFIFSNCKSDCNHVSKEINNSRPAQAITYNEMASMFNTYDKGQKIVLDKYRAKLTNGKDSIESLSHFYNLEDLKQYIAYLEKLSNDKDIKLTGLRIFSAAYPIDYKQTDLRGRETLIFMPTAKIGNKNNVAFEPLYSEKGQPIPFTKFLNKFSSDETKKVSRASFVPFTSIQTNLLPSSGANKLEPSPPH